MRKEQAIRKLARWGIECDPFYNGQHWEVRAYCGTIKVSTWCWKASGIVDAVLDAFEKKDG